jgi:hypothetical protein
LSLGPRVFLSEALITPTSGDVVAPDFIDTHIHSSKKCNIKMAMMDGITTGLDLEAGTIKFLITWTLGINWYPTMLTRFFVHYEYVSLDRFDLTGITHIWQTRFIIL